MNVEIKNTREDYLAFLRSYYLNSVGRLSLVLIPVMLICFYNFLRANFAWWKLLSALLVSILLTFILGYFLPLSRAVRKHDKAQENNVSAGEATKISVLEDGISIESLTSKLFWRWSMVISVKKTGSYIYVTDISKGSLLIPIKRFSSLNESSLFIRTIQNNLFKVQNTGEIKAGRSVYKWGYLGFIPIVGFFIGVGLVVRGIFQYKDRKLVIIGTLGILFTVILYGSLYYYGFYSEAGRKGWASISQTEVNELMKDVEFYKMQHNVYPDSLEQIRQEDRFAPIYDPLLHGSAKDRKYHYKKLDDKYTLFSVGIDGVANTADDIYPQLMAADKGRFGLIKSSQGK